MGKWRTSSLNAPACPRLCRRPFGSRGTADGLCWRASTAAGEVPLKTDVIVNNELVVRGGHGQSWDVGEAAALINSRKYAVEKMISHRFPLEKAEEAMRLFLEGPEDCIRIGLVPESGPQ